MHHYLVMIDTGMCNGEFACIWSCLGPMGTDHTLRLALVTAPFGRRGFPLACFAVSLGGVASGLPCRLPMLAGFAIPAFRAMPPRVEPITCAVISRNPCFTLGGFRTAFLLAGLPFFTISFFTIL